MRAGAAGDGVSWPPNSPPKKPPGPALGELALEFLDPALCPGERFLLNHDRLRHVVGRGRLCDDVAGDQRLGFGIARLRLSLGPAQTVEQIVDDAAFVLIHGCPLPC